MRWSLDCVCVRARACEPGDEIVHKLIFVLAGRYQLEGQSRQYAQMQQLVGSLGLVPLSRCDARRCAAMRGGVAMRSEATRGEAGRIEAS